MPAHKKDRLDKAGVYYHIYNKGIENRIIFNDEEDFSVFNSYLEEYLGKLRDPKSLKKSFTIKGKVYSGTPHQPKNYHGKIELIAWSLKPTHFHLLINERNAGVMKSFVRALSTRYSIYFNKKYKRAGMLFAGPYKSIKIDGKIDNLILITQFLHQNSQNSSISVYLGSKKSGAVVCENVLKYFHDEKRDYGKYVENHVLSDEEKKIIGLITYSSDIECLATSDLSSEEENGKKSAEKIAMSAKDNEVSQKDENFSQKLDSDLSVKTHTHLPELLIVSVFMFVVLTIFGFRNIQISSNHRNLSMKVLGASTIGEGRSGLLPTIYVTPTIDIEPTIDTTPTPVASPTAVPTMLVKVLQDSGIINLRSDPSFTSKVVGQANPGDIFQLISEQPDWFQIIMHNGTTAYISSQYAILEGVGE